MSVNDSSAPSPGGSADTPIMKQYLAAKARYPKHLLFFRVGDFYELFYDDAKTVSRALGLTLTSRNKGPDPIPMAGVPAHAAEPYLARLLRQGFSVAICDQTEDASQAKGLVKRDVTRVVTPGTVLEENLLDARKPNRIVALLPLTPDPSSSRGEGKAASAVHAQGSADTRRFGLAAADPASGSFFVQELDGLAALRAEFARLSPSELLLAETIPDSSGRAQHELLMLPLDGVAVSRLKREAFGFSEAHARVLERFGARDKAEAAHLKKLVRDLPLACAAAGALAGYIDETCPGGKVRLDAPQRFDPELSMALSESAIRSLELIETLRTRSFEGSLLWSIDRCCTPAGSRCLREWLLRPLRDVDSISARHDAVGTLIECADHRASLRGVLKQLADIERIAARLSANKATPRDLVALKETLRRLPGLQDSLRRAVENLGMLEAAGHIGDDARKSGRHRAQNVVDLPARMPDGSGTRPTNAGGPETRPTNAGAPLLTVVGERINELQSIADIIEKKLRDDCPNVLNEGGLIRAAIDEELDRLREIAQGGKGWIANFQAGEIQRTGIASLKIGYNRVFGYYIEISHANRAHAPSDYERRQTLTNAERYTTPELKTREAEVLGAEEKSCALEQRLFLELRDEIAQSAARLNAAGQALAQLDALASLAEVAHKKAHTRPVLTLNGKLALEQMRHPVLEDTLPAGELVANDVTLVSGALTLPSPGGRGEKTAGKSADKSGAQIVILTGPNMAGKSTYIRAAALCAILAQMGAFVPAERAEIGIVDRVFTRVGAADDLAGGRSTFMVEMSEVAEILTGCTSRSLLILDEVGRGTSTYDGVSLAWALIEHLHEGASKPRTLFATHYHELSALEEELPRVKNRSAAVKEWQGEITFLHRIVDGPSERSFGIHVARLAGLPETVLTRARDVLLALEEEGARRVSDITEGGAQIGESAAPARERNAARSKIPARASRDGQLFLFDAPQELDPAIHEIVERIKALDTDGMTPKQALAILDELVRKARKV
ncbi:MAG TPA: DNA mismatch repair protein MutS [Planctomycetota bacterium]|nr:DNA mismatch repair protein MutS [Planctomycetota bacterium]